VEFLESIVKHIARLLSAKVDDYSKMQGNIGQLTGGQLVKKFPAFVIN
jgi:hypothetical protein